jgi:Kef-type K+ transport system membrane component KefB
MTSLDAVPTLVLIAAIAVVSPLIAEWTRRFGIPEVVIQILFGMAIGPYALKLAHPGDVVDALSDLGLGFLMFLAGSELDLHRGARHAVAVGTDRMGDIARHRSRPGVHPGFGRSGS